MSSRHEVRRVPPPLPLTGGWVSTHVPFDMQVSSSIVPLGKLNTVGLVPNADEVIAPVALCGPSSTAITPVVEVLTAEPFA